MDQMSEMSDRNQPLIIEETSRINTPVTVEEAPIAVGIIQSQPNNNYQPQQNMNYNHNHYPNNMYGQPPAAHYHQGPPQQPYYNQSQQVYYQGMPPPPQYSQQRKLPPYHSPSYHSISIIWRTLSILWVYRCFPEKTGRVCCICLVCVSVLFYWVSLLAAFLY